MRRPVLITAGATRNPIDAMRFISAHSSGRTGAQLAAMLRSRHPVHVMGSPEACLRAVDAGFDPEQLEEYGSTRDLMERMEEWVRMHPRGVVVHASAVGDFEVDALPGKIPSDRGLTLVLRAAPKIADHVRKWSPDCSLVTFKAAAPDTSAEMLVALCRAQLQRTDSALVFGNVIGRLGNTSTLVDAHGSEALEDRDLALRALSARISAL